MKGDGKYRTWLKIKRQFVGIEGAIGAMAREFE
jgi:hypothetical protein